MRIQCQKCGRFGVSFEPARGETVEQAWARPENRPHADGSACVCGHITCASSRAALRDGGRYYDAVKKRFVCTVCPPS